MDVPIRVVLADDHPVVRDGLRRILELERDISVIGEASDGAGAMRLVSELKPDVVLLDLMMPGASGLDTLRQSRAEQSLGSTRILVLTAVTERRHLLEAVRLQVHGIVSKDADVDHLLKAIRTVAAGQYWINRHLLTEAIRGGHDQRRDNFGLTAREIEIIAAVMDGASNKELAEKLSISELTVKRHLTNIYQKVGVTSRLELAMFAIANDIGAPGKSKLKQVHL